MTTFDFEKGYTSSMTMKDFIPHELYDRNTAAKFSLGLVFILLLVTQLFKFEDFPEVLATLGLPGGEMMATLLAVVIVFIELMALPYLLSIKTRWQLLQMSRFAVLISAFLLFCLQCWAIGSNAPKAGIFGATLPLDAGVIAMIFSVGLVFASVFIVFDISKIKITNK